MESTSFTEVRAHLAQTLRAVEATQQPLLISRHGEAAAVLMAWAHYQRLAGGQDGFASRLAQWRDAHAAGLDEDPFAGMRDNTAGRNVDDLFE